MEPGIFESIKTVIVNNFNDFTWDIIGIVDSGNNVYPMTPDTKVLSKVFEMKAAPQFKQIADDLSTDENQCKLLLAETQIQYPDFTLTGGVLGDEKIAVDIKCGYRKEIDTFSGFTLGSFNGYFKNRNAKRSILFPYNDYAKHLILCFIYDRDMDIDITEVCSLGECEIPNIITNVEVILQEKWKVAIGSPGSGNTANIGSIKKISQLKNGTGPFSRESEDVFDDYWMHYIRKEDCKKMDFESQPYHTIPEYKAWNREGRVGATVIEQYYTS